MYVVEMPIQHVLECVVEYICFSGCSLLMLDEEAQAEEFAEAQWECDDLTESFVTDCLIQIVLQAKGLVPPGFGCIKCEAGEPLWG